MRTKQSPQRILAIPQARANRLALISVELSISRYACQGSGQRVKVMTQGAMTSPISMARNHQCSNLYFFKNFIGQTPPPCTSPARITVKAPQICTHEYFPLRWTAAARTRDPTAKNQAMGKNHGVEKDQRIVPKLSKSTLQADWNAKVIVFADFRLRVPDADLTFAGLHRNDSVMV